MKMNFIFILIFFAFSNCTGPQAESDGGSFLNECLESKDARFISSIVTSFEKQLISKYGAKSYKKFLSEMRSMAIPPDFFVKSDLTSFLIANKKSSSFRKIWIKQGGFFKTKPNSKYLLCLKEKSDSKTLREVLETIEKVPNINPGLTAGALESGLTDDEYNSEAIKIYLAVNIYDRFNK
ncbi:hypothetical protein QQ008_12935 [Fulvivirgaceae bacterium BMA10]|uniref:Lipoprotein n=1 Tax=Splendidivirga corallicola TaxID=3051826 RepID=A0ABT8KQ40_9BACT|nr:hypothetical protein [Fulvivirgaceae bacterium BMA10]